MSIPVKLHSTTSKNAKSGSARATKYEAVVVLVLLGRVAVLYSLITVLQSAQNHISERYGLKESPLPHRFSAIMNPIPPYRSSVCNKKL